MRIHRFTNAANFSFFFSNNIFVKHSVIQNQLGMEQSEEQPDTKRILNTKLLMVLSAGFMGMLGALGSFIPQEIAGYYGLSTTPEGVVLIKITSALYLGFAFINWLARGNLIGGIYSRPVALGNFFHFTVVTLVLLKHVLINPLTATFAVGTGIYVVFAGCFGYIAFSGGKSCS